QDFTFTPTVVNPRVFTHSDGHLTRTTFCVGLRPDKETLEKLTELNRIVHLAFGVRNFPIHTDLPVAEFPFEHQAYKFANALSQITTGSGVLHFGLPVDVNFS
ncbi:hypothetical protein KC959_02995, partial [Candidatus Saccharibacteria bacterium]|nr:hypothetical protein [Candidatus Saccharibacteria bacterium]